MQALDPCFRTVAAMSDPCDPTKPVQHISWSPDQSKLVAVSYSNMAFQAANSENSPDSYIFSPWVRVKNNIISYSARHLQLTERRLPF